MKYSLWIDGKPQGPYDARQIQNLYADGVISETDMVNPDGSKSWPMIKEVFPVDAWKSNGGGSVPFRRERSLLSFSGGQGADVNIVGINIPFWNLVVFLLKLWGAALLIGLAAAIPFWIIWAIIIASIFHR
ncbi:MAG: GYF domain-containing protein [Chthoniobacteraceae bacterium]